MSVQCLNWVGKHKLKSKRISHTNDKNYYLYIFYLIITYFHKMRVYYVRSYFKSITNDTNEIALCFDDAYKKGMFTTEITCMIGHF